MRVESNVREIIDEEVFVVIVPEEGIVRNQVRQRNLVITKRIKGIIRRRLQDIHEKKVKIIRIKEETKEQEKRRIEVKIQKDENFHIKG